MNLEIVAKEIREFLQEKRLNNSLTFTEEDHTYWLEKQLRLIELIGLQNYIQSQI